MLTFTFLYFDSHINVISVRKHLLKLQILPLIYEHIQERNRFRVMYADGSFLKVHQWQLIWEHIQANDRINVNIVERHFRIVQR